MGTYNPTNTRCQIMSYFDPGAPQYLYGSRQTFYEFLDTVLTQGYNTQAVVSITLLEEEGKEPVLKLLYNPDEGHGYRVGHMLALSGATEPVFNTTWRVISVPSSYELHLRILDTSLAIPAQATGSIISKVAPLDWEIVYSTANQRSYRSKMLNSSRNVITFKKPRHKNLNNANSPVAHEIDISKEIDLATGEGLDSYLRQSDHKMISANDNKPFGSFYFPQHSSNIHLSNTVTAGNTSRAPWYIVGDGRIFHLIYFHGDTSNPLEDSGYTNYIRGNQRYATRYHFLFGDPNSIDESDIYSGLGTVFSCPEFASNLNLARSNPASFGTNTTNLPLFFLKSYDGSINLETIHIGSVYATTNVNNFNGGGYSAQYPHKITGGFIYHPYYLFGMMGSGNNLLRAQMPYVNHCPLELGAIFHNAQMTDFDWNPKISLDGTINLHVACVSTSYTLPNSYSFNIGL